MSGPAARKVVFAPDLLGGAFIDPEAQLVLQKWRDGLLLPVVSRELLRHYLKLLDALGLPSRLLKQWTLWLTSPETSLFLEEPLPATASTVDLLLRTASAAPAEFIICNATPPNLPAARKPQFISAAAFLKSTSHPPK